MRRSLGAVLLAAACVTALLALDVGHWRGTLAADAAHPGSPPRSASAILPGDPAGALLGVDRELALRRAVRGFQIAERTGRGYDNGVTQARARGSAEAALAGVAATGSARDASQANDLVGVLAWGGANAPPGVEAPGALSVSAFTTAARLDPANEDAKANLEIALRALEAHGTRTGASPGTGPTGGGRHGAGAGTPGRGY